MIFFSITGLINCLTATGLGIFVYLNNKTSEVHQRYALFNLAVAFWSFGYIFWPIAETKQETLYWFRILHIGAIFIPVCFLHFTTAFLKINRKRVIKSGYFLSLFFLSFIFSPLFIKDMIPISIFKYWGVPGPLYHLYLLMFVIYALYACSLLYKQYRQSEGLRKAQIRCILIGMLIGYIGGSANYPLFYKIPIPPYLNIVGFIYVAMFAYAILAYKVLDIEVIIKKTLVFAGVFGAVYAVFAVFTFMGQVFFERFITTNRWIALIPSVVVVTFIFRPLENFLINITDKYLFQKRYDYKELLRTFTTEELDHIIKLKSCAILLLDEETDEFKITSSRGLKDAKGVLKRTDELAAFLGKTHTYISIAQEGPSSRIPDGIRRGMAALNAELAIPLVIHEKFIGILSFGKKKSDEAFTQDDMDILMPLARTLAIALSNAELFDQLSKTQAEAAQKEKMATIGTLAAGINHEICNPLGIARGQCEAFLLNVRDGIYQGRKAEELLEQAKVIMAKVMKETDRATSITKKLSTFAKPAKGEQEAVDVAKELEEVLALVGYELKLEKIEIEKEFEPNLASVLADKKQLQEILFNLVRNAGQAIGEQGKITVSARNHAGRVVIDIKDTGHGVPPDKVRELFNPFFTTKDPGEGTGLGLFIVRQVVERNGGKVYLKETKVGEGTTFTIEFPAMAENRAHV